MHRGSTLRGWNHAWENTGVRVGEREERGKEKREKGFGFAFWLSLLEYFLVFGRRENYWAV